MFTDNFYTIGEVAEALKLSRSTVCRQARNATLPPLHEGFLRFRGDQLRRCIESGMPWRVLDGDLLGFVPQELLDSGLPIKAVRL